jgi:hypothetical protein
MRGHTTSRSDAGAHSSNVENDTVASVSSNPYGWTHKNWPAEYAEHDRAQQRSTNVRSLSDTIAPPEPL